jgi:thiol-disulfide isomerase/thioredoxin
MSRRGAVAGLVAGTLVAASVVVALAVGADRAARLASGGAGDRVVPAEDAATAPELAGIADWLNTQPLTMAGLRGRVVLVDFWTYSCINCRRTFPFLRALHETYGFRGLTVLGVHTPEFDFEKQPDNVERAVRDLDVTWPVAEDPDRATWDAFRNEYWPADYLVDRSGRIRLVHYGEGGEAKIEDTIRTLLADGGDPGAQRAGAAGQPPSDAGITPELYLGTERRAGDEIALSGPTKATPQWVEATGAGATVRLTYTAHDVYAVLAPPAGSAAPQRLQVTLDSKPVPVGRRGKDVRERDGVTYVDVTADDLYHLVSGGHGVSDGVLTLTSTGAGVRWFTFTFGG